MNRSRLSKRLEKQTIRNLFLSILGIVIIFTVIIKFGIPLLVNYSLFVSGSKKSKGPASRNTAAFIPPPILNSHFTATNSAEAEVLVSASPNQTIELYINGNLADKSQTKSDGSLFFKIKLNPGENTIKAKATTEDDKESELSEALIIIFKSAAPTLEIKSPIEGQSFSKDQNTVEIKGATDPQVRVTVNNFWAIIDEKNNFSYTLTLREGENEIKVVAQDQAGNKTEKTIKVTYNP